MLQNNGLISKALIAVFGGIVGALIVGIGIYIIKPFRSDDARQSAPRTYNSGPDSLASPTPAEQIKVSDVKSISLETEYKGYYEEGSKCSKSYNEVFGTADGYSNEGSPCRTTLKFSRDGHATKSQELNRYDKSTRQLEVIEKNSWTSTMTAEQFNSLAGSIVSDDTFKSWRDGTMINRSNCTLTVEHNHGTRQVQSFLDLGTTGIIPMFEAVKSVDRGLVWQKE